MAYLGRPLHYDKAVQEQAQHYLDNWEEYTKAIPSVVTLCRVINRSKSTVYGWAANPECKEFADTLDAINELQEEVLLEKGLLRDHDSGITKLALGNHGYKDKQETSGDDDEKQTMEEINAKLTRLLHEPDAE